MWKRKCRVPWVEIPASLLTPDQLCGVGQVTSLSFSFLVSALGVPMPNSEDCSVDQKVECYKDLPRIMSRIGKCLINDKVRYLTLSSFTSFPLSFWETLIIKTGEQPLNSNHNHNHSQYNLNPSPSSWTLVQDSLFMMLLNS